MSPEDDDLPPDLANLIAGLPRSIEPEEDLWEGIEERIAPVPLPVRRWRVGPLALAAAVLLGAVGAWTLRGSLQPAPTAEEEATVAVARWEQDVRSTTVELQEALESRRAEMDPHALAVIDGALRDIDAAIADVRRALEDDPDNDALAMALADAWQQKVHVLRNAAELGEVD